MELKTNVKEYCGNKTDDVKIIKDYWSKRAYSYSQQNRTELECYKHNVWRNIILNNSPKKDVLKVLDIGCGPGEFSIDLHLLPPFILIYILCANPLIS